MGQSPAPWGIGGAAPHPESRRKAPAFRCSCCNDTGYLVEHAMDGDVLHRCKSCRFWPPVKR